MNFFFFRKTVNASIGCFAGEFRIRFCGKDFSRDFFYTGFLELRNLLWNFFHGVENFSVAGLFFFSHVKFYYGFVLISTPRAVFHRRGENFSSLGKLFIVNKLVRITSKIVRCLFFFIILRINIGQRKREEDVVGHGMV